MSDEFATEAPEAAPAPETAPPDPAGSDLEALQRAFSSFDAAEATEGNVSATPSEDPAELTQSDQTRTRDEKGRFVSATPTEAPPAVGEQSAEQDQAQTPKIEPPQRFNEAERAAWDQAPDAVKQGIKRAISEMEGGLAQYQERFAELKGYDDYAKSQGGTLKGYIDALVGTEQHFRQAFETQPAETFFQLGERLGFDPVEAAYRILEAVDNGQPLQMKPQQQQRPQQGSREQQLEAELAQMRDKLELQEIEKDLATFKSEVPNFDAIEARLGQELAILRAGGLLTSNRLENLRMAYERIGGFTPPQAPQAAPPAAQPHTLKAANKSVAGAPVNGSHPSHSAPSRSDLDALRKAYRLTG